MKDILIIKIGALGDVVRTTPILRVLKNNNIYWLTSKEAEPLLPHNKKIIKKILTMENLYEIQNIYFDLILNLEEDENLAKLISQNFKFKKIIGVFYNLKKEKLSYTRESKIWYDMSLISIFGIRKANQLKWKNKLTYQDILFKMIGKKFSGEEYLIDYRIVHNENKIKFIAIEKNAGAVWPMKKWPYYHLLKKKLEKIGFNVFYLKYHKNIINYVKEIEKCDILICGDTLAMHLGLALKKKILAIFTCTSPYEIYNYGRMIKVINPKLKIAFYKRFYNRKLVSAIKVNDVLNKFYDLCKGYDIYV